jgi:hypothetical protein
VTAVAWALLILGLATLFTLATEWLRANGEQDRADEETERAEAAEANAAYWRAKYHDGVGRLIADLHAPSNVVSLWSNPAAGRIADRVAGNEAQRLDDELCLLVNEDET